MQFPRTRCFNLAAALLIGLAACQPPRSPVIKKPLPIEDKPSSAATAPKAPKGDIVRIGIRIDSPEVSVTSLATVKATDLVLNNAETWPPAKYLFRVADNQLSLDGTLKGKKWRLHSEDPDKPLQCGDKTYRGDLIIRVGQNGGVTVINELGIDDYLKGVLPREVIVTWPDQALRVQAVASRTYLASHLGSHSSQGFDLCSDVHCQVYGGMSKEHPKTNEAVDATRDQILIYEGKPISAFFFSHCGGITENPEPVWGSSNKPYLPRKKCPYCKDNPRYNWSNSFSFSDILSALKAKTKVKGDKLKGVRIKSKSGSGRARAMTIVTDGGTFTLGGNEFRLAMNPEKIRSTLLTSIQKHGDSYQFTGRGWGHGVGMCQWGAKGQAELGKKYREILEFYYPGAELEKWSR